MGTNRVTGSNLDDARAARNDRLNPPEYAPGQEDDFFDDDIFSTGGDSIEVNNNLGADSGFNFSGSTDMFGGAGMFNAPQQQQTQQQIKSTEDKIFDAMAKGAKGSFNFTKEFVASLKLVTPKFWATWGSNTFIVGIVFAVLGIVLSLFRVGAIGTDFLVGGLLSSALGILVLMLQVDKAKNYTSYYKDGGMASVTPSTIGEAFDGLGSGGAFDDFEDNSDGFDDFGDDDFDDSDDWGDDEGFDEGSDDSAFFDTPVTSEPMSTEDALASMTEVPKGMYTRQYLYEMFIKVLPNIKPDFATNKVVDENSDTFIAWEQYLRDACETTGVKQEALPTLLSLEENLFTIRLTFERPIGLKADAVATEIANIYAYGDGTNVLENVSAKADVVGKRCFITLFTGESAMISLLDMYGVCKDFMLDTKNYMPVVLGIDQRGNVIKADFKKMESVIVTGMPRSGKSWFIKDILIQMCVFVPPSELNIYVCDPKEKVSDFKHFKLPHVKRFVSGDNNILEALREVVKVIAPKRRRIIGDAGCLTIWEYKEIHPEVHMPVIYVLIDEVVTLASRMDKDTNTEFRMLLRELISQLPALGIRAFLIPHILNNDIIEKKTSDIVDCKVSVRGDAEHIEKATGSKFKEFPYKLANMGDMAVRMPLVSPNTMFVHAPVICETNPKINGVFEYMGRVWSKLEPEEVKGSLADGLDDSVMETMVSEMTFDDADLDDFDLFGDNNEEQCGEPQVFSNTNDDGLSGISQAGIDAISDDDYFF